MRERHSAHWMLVATPLTLVALILAGCGSSGSTTTVASGSSGSGPSASVLADSRQYSPKIDPSNFVTTIDNPHWPLKPGTTFHYKGVRPFPTAASTPGARHQRGKPAGAADRAEVLLTGSRRGDGEGR
jgi:hypothetical protein